ncbi:hypothetical protein [Pseudomonas sp.]|uniref:hypothetical protein n=1 Tax=Pseudomonas sp. TaxID=306 RepID=UPI002ED7FABB
MGVTSKSVEKKSVVGSGATLTLQAPMPNMDSAGASDARYKRVTNAENEKSPSMTGFLFMSSGLAGVFDFGYEDVRVRSDSRLLADFETF